MKQQQQQQMQQQQQQKTEDEGELLSGCSIGSLGWSGVSIDYIGEEVSALSLIKVLLGIHAAYTPENKRLKTNAASNVVVFVAGHGGDEFLKFKDWDLLLQQQLAAAVQQMQQLKRFYNMLLIAETCQAATLLQAVHTPQVLRISSSLKGQSSYSFLTDSFLGVALIDRWSYSVINFFNQAANSDLAAVAAAAAAAEQEQQQQPMQMLQQQQETERNELHTAITSSSSSSSSRRRPRRHRRSNRSNRSSSSTSSSRLGVGRLLPAFIDLFESFDYSFLMSSMGVEEAANNIKGSSLTNKPLSFFFSSRDTPQHFSFSYPSAQTVPAAAAAAAAAAADADVAAAGGGGEGEAAKMIGGMQQQQKQKQQQQELLLQQLLLQQQQQQLQQEPLLLWQSAPLRVYPLLHSVIQPHQQQQQQEQQEQQQLLQQLLLLLDPKVLQSFAVLLAGAVCLATAAAM